MFERYNEAARRTLFFARYEANEHGSRWIEPEHLLLGLIRDEETTGTVVLQGRPLRGLRAEVAALVPREPRPMVVTEIPFSPATRQVLDLAAKESDGLEHSHIGTEHLLLALLPAAATAAGALLARHGFSAGDLRRRLTPGPAPPATPIDDHLESIAMFLGLLAADLADDAAATALVARIREDVNALKSYLTGRAG